MFQPQYQTDITLFGGSSLVRRCFMNEVLHTIIEYSKRRGDSTVAFLTPFNCTYIVIIIIIIIIYYYYYYYNFFLIFFCFYLFIFLFFMPLWVFFLFSLYVFLLMIF
jgi:hypothetical protein